MRVFFLSAEEEDPHPTLSRENGRGLSREGQGSQDMNPGKIFAALTGMLMAGAVHAAAPTVPVSLWRLDCGKITAFDLDEFSDTHAYVGQHKDLAASCYLIRHGDTWMLWDTGLPKALMNHVM